MNGKTESKQELLIIRRSGGDDNAAHKGGAWKIAYADFVTAMMAFFLVMWLINSANEVTKARVASYFNPIKMTDASPAKRGLKEETYSQSPRSNANEEKNTGGEKKSEASGDSRNSSLELSEEQMLMNPYSALDELVRHSKGGITGPEQSSETSAAGDPFDPRSFELIAQREVTSQISASPSATQVAREGRVLPEGSSSNMSATPSRLDHHDQVGPNLPLVGQAAQKRQLGTFRGIDRQDERGLEQNSTAVEKVNQVSEEDRQFADALRSKIDKKVTEFRDSIDLRVNVQITDEGLLISLEDGQRRSMFSVGSAQPNPALIEIVGSIGSLLSDSQGQVVVRGHTDGRQFRNRRYDNWQLSTDRAHMASYMLVRGGLDEHRIQKIEGFGFSTPLVANDVMADVNRRVEFLLAR